MSAPNEDTFAEEVDEMEEMDEVGSDADEGVEMEEDGEGEKKVYVPGIEPLQPGEELEMDRSAYRMYHECQTGECSMSELRHPERRRWRKQGAVSSVHVALCRNTS
eukprot:superscaffoldBa00001423_g10477